MKKKIDKRRKITKTVLHREIQYPCRKQVMNYPVVTILATLYLYHFYFPFYDYYSLSYYIQDLKEPNGKFNCLSSIDCAMNGECRKCTPSDPQSPGSCHCFSGWKGPQCEQLDLLPVSSLHSGLRLPNYESSWGGSIIEQNGTYHMFASEIINQCGLETWTTNSQIIRAVSKSLNGPYQKKELILPTFAHDANAIQAPTGEIVLFVTALRGVVPVNCTSAKPYKKDIVVEKRKSPPKDTYMLWANHPEGPFSEPILVLNSTIWNEDYWPKVDTIAHCDSNLNGIIRDDGSFLGLWRRCETPELLTIPHMLYASDWRNASTYQPNPNPLFVLGGSGAGEFITIFILMMEICPSSCLTLFNLFYRRS